MKRMTGLMAICAAACVSVAFCEEPKALDSTNLEQLRAHSGEDVVVEGLVTDVGTTQTKSITFINMGLQKKQGFVVVVFQKNYGSFPDGFSAYKGQKLRVSGKLELYQGERPEIEARSPEQIQILGTE